jgi:hypothetical protein
LWLIYEEEVISPASATGINILQGMNRILDVKRLEMFRELCRWHLPQRQSLSDR